MARTVWSNGRSDTGSSPIQLMCWRSGRVQSGGDVRKETVDLHTAELNNGAVWKVWYRATPSLSAHPIPLSAVCPIYPARAAISTQWSNANGAWVQEVGDGCGSERNRQEVLTRDTNKDTKEGSWGRNLGCGRLGLEWKTGLFLPALHQLWSVQGQLHVEEMWTDVFKGWGGVGGCDGDRCQRVRVGSAHSAMDSSVENVSLPKKEMP